MLEPLRLLRVVATPEALDHAAWGPGPVLRVAPDEALFLGDEAPELADPHAIVSDDRGWSGKWVEPADLGAYLRSAAEWVVPSERPALAQGMVAGLPVKVWVEHDRALIVVARAFAHDLAHRLPDSWRAV